eukprot:Phypoly_transcript_01659.p1 GENE.Phypoly_transcript_01659~~Phypoly_transcript_01659.p1  ORF type:complete len:665 (-),score=123.41 Phypoly_transcript_01659:37-2031(-)
MPLLGKVPWELDPPPAAGDGNEYWMIRFTNEAFGKYEDYLKRIELYRDRVWTCKITEKSGLTFEEAALSEKRSSLRAECFPDVYLEPFLHIVHLSTLTLAELVEHIHNHFKENFVPGEQVECYIHEKWILAKIIETLAKSAQSGNKAEVSYKVELLNGEGSVTVLQSAVRRKKYTLSKPMIKQKIRQVATRDRHSSSPWLVDYGLTRRYNLPAYDGMGTVTVEEEESDGEKEASRPAKRVKTYPMEDLDIERSDKKKLPPVSTEFVVPVECVGDLFTAWHFVFSFGKGLQLSPFSLDDLESALLHPSELDLTDELHFRLLRLVFNQKRGSSLPKKAINKESWKDVLLRYVEKCAGEKPRSEDKDSSSNSSSGDDESGEGDEGEQETDDQTTTTTTTNTANGATPISVQKANFRRIAEALRKESWYELPVQDKVMLLKHMCEAALQSDVIRTQIENFIEASIELDKEMKEQEIVDKKRQKEIEKAKAKAPPKKANAKTKAAAKEPEKNTEVMREAQKQARREEALDKHNIRLISIGQDRYHNRYWYWNALHGRLFVEQMNSNTSSNGHSTNSHSTNSTNTSNTTWGYYQTKSELDALLEFLDERGIRELSLRAALTKKYPKMVAAMEKRAHEMTLPATEVRRSSRIKTTRTEKDPPFMTYVNKFA